MVLSPASMCETPITRRQLLARTGMGMGLLGLAALVGEGAAKPALGAEASGLLASRKPHFPAKAKHVIHIFAEGAPSQMDTWDPKPELLKQDGKPIPGYKNLAFGSPFKFTKHGQSGIEVSEVFPNLAGHVDQMAVIRSMWTDIPAHETAQDFLATGSSRLPKPSMGSWVVYGLGLENQNLPGFITLGGRPEWRRSSFLPGVFQGVNVNIDKNMKLDEVLLNIRSPFTSLDAQRKQLDLAQQLNALHRQSQPGDDQLDARIQSFEMAFRMQTEAVDAFNIEREPEEIRKAYGNARIGKQLLTARRLVERGVRFVQVRHGGWDHHSNLQRNLPKVAAEVDEAAAALLADLKQRGLLDETLVIWCGEFGRSSGIDRTSTGDAAKSAGRDHNGRAAVCWMAGGGVKGGVVHGATDDFGGRAVEGRMHIHDLHATILALLGFDHTKLTYRYNGRDFRLTDNYGAVVREIIA
jgi:uncharacterized protein (DUF1501 family)